MTSSTAAGSWAPAALSAGLAGVGTGSASAPPRSLSRISGRTWTVFSGATGTIARGSASAGAASGWSLDARDALLRSGALRWGLGRGFDRDIGKSRPGEGIGRSILHAGHHDQRGAVLSDVDRGSEQHRELVALLRRDAAPSRPGDHILGRIGGLGRA